MSEPIPEAIPTSADPRSRRPVKRARGPNTALSTQANEVESLFLDPSRPITLPAGSSASKSSVAAPPEIVANVQGSSAGAGSGEFHVYKASRRREYERLRVMDEEAKKEEDNEKWEREAREKKARDEERTRKNREKRNKKNKKGGEKDTIQKPAGGTVDANATGESVSAIKKKNGALQVPRRGSQEERETADLADGAVVKENGITILDDD